MSSRPASRSLFPRNQPAEEVELRRVVLVAVRHVDRGEDELAEFRLHDARLHVKRGVVNPGRLARLSGCEAKRRIGAHAVPEGGSRRPARSGIWSSASSSWRQRRPAGRVPATRRTAPDGPDAVDVPRRIFMENHCRIFGNATKEAQRAARSARLPILEQPAAALAAAPQPRRGAALTASTSGRIGPRDTLCAANPETIVRRRRPARRLPSQRAAKRDRRRHGLQRRVLRQRRAWRRQRRW